MREGARSQIPSHLTGIITNAKASSLEPSSTMDWDRPPITVLTSLSPSLSLAHDNYSLGGGGLSDIICCVRDRAVSDSLPH